MRTRRILKWAGALLLVALCAFIFGWVPYFLGGIATTRRFQYNDRANNGLTPASFSLPFEEVSFQAADGVPLKGWWVPAPDAKGTVVMIHGLNRSRLEMVKKVPFVHEQGWNALLFDVRHHGASGGNVSGFGWLERKDAEAAKAYSELRSKGPVVLWGVSLGAATAVFAAADDPSVAGVVSDSSYRSLPDTVVHHLQLFRGFRWWLRIVPSWPVGDEVIFWMGRRGGFNPRAVDVQAAAARLAGRPVLFVCNAGDRRMPPDIAFDLKTAAGERAKVLVVPGNTHGEAYRDGKPAYESAVADLLHEAAAGPATRLASGRPN
ncbi:MAG TPA: alpha/beta fold hydrolase [Vicinamibacteria bacterium]